MEFEHLKGKIVTSIDVRPNRDEIVFKTKDGLACVLYHEQDCCEEVEIKQIDGDLNDLLNTEILEARVSTNWDSDDALWTFYHIRTIKGSVTISWVGNSDGPYSVEVDCKWFNIDDLPEHMEF